MEDKPVVTDPFVTLYTIKSILEDVDFGCEDRVDGDIPKAIAVLVSDDREEISLRMDDALFYERGLKEGSRVFIDENGTLQKVTDAEGLAKEVGK